MIYEAYFLAALALTIFFEGVVIYYMLPIFKEKRNLYEILLAAAVPSSLTLPYLWFVLPPILGFRNAVILGEISIFFVEAFLLKKLLKLDAKKATLLSAFANALSFIAGLVLIG